MAKKDYSYYLLATYPANKKIIIDYGWGIFGLFIAIKSQLYEKYLIEIDTLNKYNKYNAQIVDIFVKENTIIKYDNYITTSDMLVKLKDDINRCLIITKSKSKSLIGKTELEYLISKLIYNKTTLKQEDGLALDFIYTFFNLNIETSTISVNSNTMRFVTPRLKKEPKDYSRKIIIPPTELIASGNMKMENKDTKITNEQVNKMLDIKEETNKLIVEKLKQNIKQLDLELKGLAQIIDLSKNNKKELVNIIYKEAVNLYFDFYKNILKMGKPDFGAAEGAAMKRIIEYYLSYEDKKGMTNYDFVMYKIKQLFSNFGLVKKANPKLYDLCKDIRAITNVRLAKIDLIITNLAKNEYEFLED